MKQQNWTTIYLQSTILWRWPNLVIFYAIYIPDLKN